MAKRVFIGVGHGGKDPGAIGYVREEDANLTIALELKRLLEATGDVIVGISRTKDEDDPLSEEIREANAFKPDLAIDVHNNAGKGDGWEAWVQTNAYAKESRAAAEAIEKQVKAIGQNSRGIKTKKNSAGLDHFGFLRLIHAPAIIPEGFFVDNAKDAADFDTKAEQKRLAAAYAAGIIEYLKIEAPKPVTGKKSNEEIAKEVIAGKWGNGSERTKRLTAAGYNAAEIQKLVNNLLAKPSRKSNEEIAKEVIAGKWGNGSERTKRLTAAGYNAAEIQKIVNKLLA